MTRGFFQKLWSCCLLCCAICSSLGDAVDMDDADLSIVYLPTTSSPRSSTTTAFSSCLTQDVVKTVYDGDPNIKGVSYRTTEDLFISSATVTTKKNNIATFAAAIGGSVGILSLIALGLAFSIIKRRRKYERQERAASQSDVSPQMIGPRPFVPRFFPGTYPDPPPYAESLTAPAPDGFTIESSPTITHASNAVAARPTSVSNQNTSYADVPPSTPPPLSDAFDILPAPPPFGVAISANPSLHESEVASPRCHTIEEGTLSSDSRVVQVESADGSRTLDIAQ